MKLIKKIVLVFGLLLFVCIGCKKQQDSFASENVNPMELDTISNTKDTVLKKEKSQLRDTLSLERLDFKAMLNSIKHVKHSGDKHKDWMTNNKHNRLLSNLLNIDLYRFKISTTSYEYKQKCKFYVHTLQHVDDTISMAQYIKNSINTKTGGYIKVRFLFFAMKDSLVAHFLDIPPNYGNAVLKDELIEKIFERIDSEAIFCKYSDPCKLQDFGKLEGVNETN